MASLYTVSATNTFTSENTLSYNHSSPKNVTSVFDTKSVHNKRRLNKKKTLCKSSSFDHIPKQFRQENLKEGWKENFNNVPDFLFGLHPPHLGFFENEFGLVKQQAKRVTEDSLLPSKHYTHFGNQHQRDQPVQSRFTMSANRYDYGGLESRNPPPDVPSLLLDANVLYIGLPLVPAVTDLILAELVYLNWARPGEPIFVYINSSGTLNEKHETLALDTDAYAIADLLTRDTREIHTVNVGCAFGHAGMLLSLGTKGYRFVTSHSLTSLYLPRSNGDFGTSDDILSTAGDLEEITKTYVNFVSHGTGKTTKQILSDLRGPMTFGPQEAIDYGVADIMMVRKEKSPTDFGEDRDNIFL